MTGPLAPDDALARDLADLLAMPYTDPVLGPVVTVADLRRVLQRHAGDAGVPEAVDDAA